MLTESEDLDVVEIYPKIFVYKNLYKDINFIYQSLKESDGTEGFFNPWSKWSDFGQYISPTFKGYDYILQLRDVMTIEAKTEKEKEHKDILLEILNNFYTATKDYIKKNNVDFDENRIVPNVKDKNGNPIKEWVFSGPSIARYRTDITDPVAMTYHTDYIREPIVSPGHKFAITALTYFNDDYEDGEIDFVVNGEAYMYKPEAGDLIVFPSGHPDFLMSENHIYLHGVMPARNNEKYLSRMYWTKYSVGDPKWFENEEKFGKEKWYDMQHEIMQKFREDNPNKFSTEKERRIK
jgi:2OG-Fe(II) oxygenase superfamily